ncbi:MAG: hypothetical protein AVDCRST_MAG68-2208, partial [uncultured Gemmatimonadetes bacterium]
GCVVGGSCGARTGRPSPPRPPSPKLLGEGGASSVSAGVDAPVETRFWMPQAPRSVGAAGRPECAPLSRYRESGGRGGEGPFGAYRILRHRSHPLQPALAGSRRALHRCGPRGRPAGARQPKRVRACPM